MSAKDDFLRHGDRGRGIYAQYAISTSAIAR